MFMTDEKNGNLQAIQQFIENARKERETAAISEVIDLFSFFQQQHGVKSDDVAALLTLTTYYKLASHYK
jgi:hypothetical protein